MRHSGAAEPPKQKYYRNLIHLKFYPNAPNKVWVSDTTYLYLDYEAYYLTVFLDLYSRKVIGFELVDSLEASPLIEIFKKTYAERGCPKGLIFHSDQGSAYTAYRFRVLLRGFKVKPSFSAPGEPRDNSVAESFF